MGNYQNKNFIFRAVIILTIVFSFIIGNTIFSFGADWLCKWENSPTINYTTYTTGSYKTESKDAIDQWNSVLSSYCKSKIQLKTSTSSSADIIIYSADYGRTTWVGTTINLQYDARTKYISKKPSIRINTWHWVNNSLYKGKSTNLMQWVSGHEQGHALGLPDLSTVTYKEKALMWYTDGAYLINSIYTPQTIDKQRLDQAYYYSAN